MGLHTSLVAQIMRAGPLAEEPCKCAGAYGAHRIAHDGMSNPTQDNPVGLAALVIITRFASEPAEDSLAPECADDLVDPDLFGSVTHFYHTVSCGQFELTRSGAAGGQVPASVNVLTSSTRGGP